MDGKLIHIRVGGVGEDRGVGVVGGKHLVGPLIPLVFWLKKNTPANA